MSMLPLPKFRLPLKDSKKERRRKSSDKRDGIHSAQPSDLRYLIIHVLVISVWSSTISAPVPFT